VGLVRGLSIKTSQLLGFVGIATLCGLLSAAFAVPVVGALAYATNTGVREVGQFPAELKIPSLDGRSYVYDRSGGLLATFFTHNRVYVPITKIAPTMRQAIVDIEDERFYQHGAADLRGTLRALAANAQSGTTQGGSTLTQQYVKNILVNNATTPAQLSTVLYKRHVSEKLRELKYAIALEEKLSKPQILEGYLNIAPFGQNLYGVEAASEYYFSTTAAKLTIPQAAMLAGEVQAPSLYDPTAGGTHVVQARDRRDTVLAKMYQLHHIPKATYDAAVRSPLGLHTSVPKQGCAAADTSPWYCDYVERTLDNDPSFAFLGSTSQDRSNRIRAGGLRIYTALDPAVQGLADAGMAKATNPTDSTIVSTAIVKPGTGDVLAVSNSKRYDISPKPPAGSSALDYAVPYAYGQSVGFQPGSSMKPITMAVALTKGLPLSYRIKAASGLYYRDFPYRTCSGDDAGGGPAKIQNEGGQNYGSITMLQGIWESVNSYFAQLESKVGLCPVARLAAKLGVTTVDLNGPAKPAPLKQVPTLTLGTNNTSPLQMSEVYATLAAHGVYCPPRVVTRIVDVDSSRTLYDEAPRCTRVIAADVADAIGWALYHNVRGDIDPRSTAHPAEVYDKNGNVIPTAGKTGTTDAHNAVWFNGYNSQFAASLAVAMPKITDSVSGQRIGGSTVGSATGGTTAGTIWLGIMRPVYEAQRTHPGFIDAPARKFDATAAMASAKGQVPDLVGSSLTDAEAQLTQAQFAWTVSSTPIASSVPAGLVAATSPAAGSPSDPAATVTIYLSTGTPVAGPTPGHRTTRRHRASTPPTTAPTPPTGPPTGAPGRTRHAKHPKPKPRRPAGTAATPAG